MPKCPHCGHSVFAASQQPVDGHAVVFIYCLRCQKVVGTFRAA